MQFSFRIRKKPVYFDIVLESYLGFKSNDLRGQRNDE